MLVHKYIRKYSLEDWLFQDAKLWHMDNECGKEDGPFTQNTERDVLARQKMRKVIDEICRRTATHNNLAMH